MERFYLKLWLIVGVVFLSGCYNVSTIYDGDNLYTVTAVSASELDANNMAMEKAIKICDFRPYKVQVLEHISRYQGMDAQEKALVGEAHNAIGVSGKTTSARDYKAIIRFKCKTPDKAKR